MKKSLCFLLFLCATFIGNSKTSGIAWIDSTVADLTRQMVAAQINQTKQVHHANLLGLQRPSFQVVVDVAKWMPIQDPADSANYYYDSQGANLGFANAEERFDYDITIDQFNTQYKVQPNYVAYYNVVLRNFPFNLAKDISGAQLDQSTDPIYNQLLQLKAVKDQEWTNAVKTFESIIQQAANQVPVLYAARQRVLVFGSCSMSGFYGNRINDRASFFVYSLKSVGISSESWLPYLYQVPKRFKSLAGKVSDYDEHNRNIAFAIQEYLSCNLYNACNVNENIFANQQARRYWSNLKEASNLDKPKLLRACMDLNGLSETRAFCVLMAGHDDQVATYNDVLSFVYTGVTNAHLDKTILRCRLIQRADKQLRENTSISRDSVLYYGYLLYRDASYWGTGISTGQRINLLGKLGSAICSDVGSVNEANDPSDHCERIALLLTTSLPIGEEKVFLNLLRSTGLLGTLSFRLDESTVGFYGANHYTQFIMAICGYWRKAYPERLSAGKTTPLNITIFKWDDSFWNQNSWISFIPSNNQIKAEQLQLHQVFSSTETPAQYFDVYDAVIVNPLNDNQTLGVPAGQQFVVPAIFLDWLSTKKTWADVGVATEVTLVTLGMFVGIGEVYVASNAVMRGVALVATVLSAGDLVLLNQTARSAVVGCFSNQADGEAFVETYRRLTLVMNMALVSKGLFVSFYDDVRAFRLGYAAKQNQLNTALGINSAEMRGLREMDEALAVEGLAGAEGFQLGSVFKAITTDVATALNNRINHIRKIVFEAKSNGTYKFSGCHSKSAIDELGANARIEVTIPANAEGVYEAKVFAKGPDGIEIPKSGNQGKSTFFPDSWSEAKILEEAEHAVKNNKGFANGVDATEGYYGFSKDGKIKIQFYYRDSDGFIGSFFPKLD
jgi:hypothetical protein